MATITKFLSKASGDTSTKDAIKRVCLLKPMQSELTTIQLNAGLNIVGRSKETGIKDARCSKRQLQLDVIMKEHCYINLKVLGINPCGVNGLMAMQLTKCKLEHGDVLEIVYGRHAFEVVFKPPPLNKTNEKDNIDIPTKQEKAELQVNDTASWHSIENGKALVYTSVGVRASSKIASYDIDGTIIRTKSGNVFPKTIDDWQINYAERVPQKLKDLHQDGFKICFFTNQGGIAKGKVKLDEFKQKVCHILDKLGIPVQVFIAIADGYYRKPLPGMWEHMRDEQNGSVPLQLERCFFVGDAAGRPEMGTGVGKRKKDHSCADRFFATNVGISFYTPEEHFLGKKTEEWITPDFYPDIYVERECQLLLLQPPNTKVPSYTCEMIIMVGLPGSGKSHFTQQHLATQGYKIASADKLGSTLACLKTCERELTSGNSCVVDNTNVDVESRKKFIELAKRLSVPCRCFVMNVSGGHVKHNIAFRQLTDTTHSKINEMLLNMMKKKYKAPTLDEGYTEVVNVNLKPSFSSAKLKQLYKLYLVEK